jgi:hypothetical protein
MTSSAASTKGVSHRTVVAQKELHNKCKFGQWARSPKVMSSASLAQAFSVDTPVPNSDNSVHLIRFVELVEALGH